MPQGKVKWYESSMRYGFIRPLEEGRVDILLHYNDLVRSRLKTIKKDQEIEYDLETDEKGQIRAENIRLRYSATEKAKTKGK